MFGFFKKKEVIEEALPSIPDASKYPIEMFRLHGAMDSSNYRYSRSQYGTDVGHKPGFCYANFNGVLYIAFYLQELGWSRYIHCTMDTRYEFHSVKTISNPRQLRYC